MKNKFLTALICSVCCLNAYAKNQDKHKFYLGAEATYAMSLSASIDVNNAIDSISGASFDAVACGYNNNLKQSLGYGFLAGYNISDIFALELAYTNRPSFKYEKFQAVPRTSVVGNRTRHFDLQSQTTMLNGVIHLTPIFDVLKNLKEHSNLEPFINLGAGFAQNTVTNLHTIGSANAPNGFNGASYSIMPSKTVYKLAAQVGAGLDYNLNSRWKAKVGYRYIYGGKFASQNYITDNPDGLGSGNSLYTGTSVFPWLGTLKANEVYLGLTYSL